MKLAGVFGKLLAVFLSISLISLIGISFLISVLLETKLRTTKENEMREFAVLIRKMIHEYDLKKIRYYEVIKQFNEIQKYYNIQTTIVKNPENPQRLFSLGLSIEAMDWIKSVYSGNQNAYIGAFKSNGQDLLVLGFPIESKDKAIQGIFLSTPIADVKSLSRAMNQIIFLSFLITSIVIGLLIYWVSRKIVQPINQMSRIASQMTQGNFQERVPVNGNDEISRLAFAFNLFAGKIHLIEQNRSRFLGEIAHELRTPLTTVYGTIRASVDGSLSSSEQAEFLAISLEELKRLNRLTDQLIELSKFEEQNVILNMSEIDVSELVSDTIRMFSEEAAKYHMILSATVTPGIIVKSDADRLKQVIVNLVNNAISHSPDGTLINLFVRSYEDHCELIVANDGPEIPEDRILHIFERFYKSEQRRSGTGSGLGLTISKSIVERLGGRITVQSGSMGTSFTISIPTRPNNDIITT